MDQTIDYIVERMKEPSTYVSLGSLLTAIGFTISPENWQAIAFTCMGLGGLIGTFLSDRRTKKSEIKEMAEKVVVENVKDSALTNGLKEKVDAADRR